MNWKTWKLKAHILAVPFGAVLSLWAGGCHSSEYYHRQVYADRLASYEAWHRSRTQPAETTASVEGKLTLQDAVKVALLYNKPLQAVLKEKEVARGRVVESYSEVLPKVSAIGSYTRLDEVGGFNIGGQNVSIGELDNYSVDLQVRQPIFHGGAISAALRSARLFSCLTEETIRSQVQATIFNVASAYYEALLARRLYEVNKDAVESARVHLRDVEVKRGQGVASDFDVLRAKVDVSLLEAEMVEQENRLHLAKARLLKVMGVSQESNVEFADRLSYEPLKPVLEEAVRIAQLNRPDLYQAELRIHSQEEAVRIAKSRYWPQVDLLFTQTWARPDPHTSADRWGNRWLAGIQVEVPILDGLRREGRLMQEKAALERRKIELKQAEEQTLLEIRQALLSVRDAEKLVESQRLNVERAKEALRLAEAGYREGVNSEVEVIDARAALTRARGLYYQALYAHIMARLALQRAMGILGPRAGEPYEGGKVSIRPGEIGEFTAPSKPGSSGLNGGSDAPPAGKKGEH